MQTKDSLFTLLRKRPLIIAGPCSAESEEQTLTTAHQLAELGKVDIFRAGIWKPRTRPGQFEGVGRKGLLWLQKVKEETNLPVIIEVGNAHHTENALKASIDCLWIGARTTVNPFSVQEIASALKGVDIPIFVKNPVSCDIDLWIGAIERFLHVGLKDLGMIHRGFSTHLPKETRNAPIWSIPVQMQEKFPDLPLLCDPSHIAGNRTFLLSLAQHSARLQFDGLIIETHPDPNNALTDSKQQITPEQLGILLDKINWNNNNIAISPDDTLHDLRENIDYLDDQLLNILKKRKEIVHVIGNIKKTHDLPILQSKRWERIKQRLLAKGKASGINNTFLQTLLEGLHETSINEQKQLMNNDKPNP